ncbi:DUF397 domain-containing protein [Nocardiopsis tropica]|uniref:DUF397 domain-containing protein n=1 Tax=Nocardiopsis tropica TaxID=109330 RepID=A0ABU7KUY6_9ACTN|nr:DUF397 domain-containing protein [Nocardiopsis umidischolae]MEE2053105.1 DUF397 domain-containing protein [Nocardiopsis umidischolae]
MTAEWHKSSYSSGNNECVEVREYAAGADVRDTQNRSLGHIAYSSDAWAAFLSKVKQSSR